MLPNVLPSNAADHTPVLADEVRELLAVQPGETVVDATFGAGGHARLLSEDLRGDGKLVAIDRDPSVKQYFDRLKASRPGVDLRFLRGDFALVLSQLAGNGVKADAILLDLGVSSMQIDRPERGFSYATDAPLDMRMDPSSEPSAADIVNTWDERELAVIFKRYGEERYAGPIARAIVKRRAEREFTRTGDLVDVIKLAIPTPARFGEGHPAKRVFQALRIAVNDELAQLRDGAPRGPRDASPRRPARRDQLPLARGPHRQAGLRRRRQGLHVPARLPGVHLRQAAGAPPADEEGRAPVRPRDRREPTLRIRPAARRREGRRLVSTVIESPRLDAASRRRKRAGSSSRRPFAGGVLWIAAVGVLLAGIVAVNVLVLQLNMQLDGLGRERAGLKADNARLRSQLSSASAQPSIERDATTRLGLQAADVLTLTYVDLARTAK